MIICPLVAQTENIIIVVFLEKNVGTYILYKLKNASMGKWVNDLRVCVFDCVKLQTYHAEPSSCPSPHSDLLHSNTFGTCTAFFYFFLVLRKEQSDCMYVNDDGLSV
jgi:hypothetical protein